MLEWEWYTDINTTRLFIHMLLKANWKDGNFKGTTVSRGSFVSSIGKLAGETGLTEREIRTAISHLKKTGEVTSKTTNKYTVFTVVKYDLYQTSDKQNDSQETSKRHSNANNRRKERRKEGKKYTPYIPRGAVRGICGSIPEKVYWLSGRIGILQCGNGWRTGG